MKHRSFSSFVGFAGFPVTRKTATNSNHTAKVIGIGKGEAIIERARLRETEQEHALRVGHTFLNQRLRQVKQRAVMKRDRLFRVKVSEPAKAEAQRAARLFRFFQVLMKTLQRSDGELLRRHLLRLAHHLPLVCSIAVQGDQQRRGLYCGLVKIVIEFDFSSKTTFDSAGLA